MNSIRDLASKIGFDKYARQARLKPALLVVLPVFVTVAVWLPKVWTLLGGLTAMVTTCGLTFLLADLARFQGKKVERQMIAANGGKFTTIFLRYSDSTISTATKETYHSFLKKASRRKLPSPEAEKTEPAAADDCYRGAVEWLLEATRSEKRFPLVRLENISYGFRRNLLGLKQAATLIVGLCLVANVFFCFHTFRGDSTRALAGGLVAVALLAVEGVWLRLINIPFVEDAGRAYALRLLAQCDVLQTKQQARARKV